MNHSMNLFTSTFLDFGKVKIKGDTVEAVIASVGEMKPLGVVKLDDDMIKAVRNNNSEVVESEEEKPEELAEK